MLSQGTPISVRCSAAAASRRRRRTSCRTQQHLSQRGEHSDAIKLEVGVVVRCGRNTRTRRSPPPNARRGLAHIRRGDADDVRRERLQLMSLARRARCRHLVLAPAGHGNVRHVRDVETIRRRRRGNPPRPNRGSSRKPGTARPFRWCARRFIVRLTSSTRPHGREDEHAVLRRTREARRRYPRVRRRRRWAPARGHPLAVHIHQRLLRDALAAVHVRPHGRRIAVMAGARGGVSARAIAPHLRTPGDMTPPFSRSLVANPRDVSSCSNRLHACTCSRARAVAPPRPRSTGSGVP